MHGSGTRPGTIPNSTRPGARLLDLTRSVRRAGRNPTGIDRVERAYLARLIEDPIPLFGLIRTRLGYLLLDQEGCRRLQAKLEGVEPWGPPDRLSRWLSGHDRARRIAEADARRLATRRCLPSGLGRLPGKALPPDTAYLNVGHSGLSLAALRALRQAGLRTGILLHDVIPLEHPALQRQGTAAAFEAKLRAVSEAADLVIYNSADTQRRAEALLAGFGRVPPALSAHLGIEAAPPPPHPVAGDRPHFVALGTIEPRKNHALLLDFWALLARRMPAADLPRLHICGARGWCNKAVFDRLDALPADGVITEHNDLGDAEVTALIAGSAGLLQPSLAEGFGLPVVEAAALGVPVLCLPLPVYREVLGDIPIYLAESDRYLWADAVESLSKGLGSRVQAVPGAVFEPPRWSDHFNAVLRFT
jgi:glycosyltransferase involved in cell wall biosynthesis